MTEYYEKRKVVVLKEAFQIPQTAAIILPVLSRFSHVLRGEIKEKHAILSGLKVKNMNENLKLHFCVTKQSRVEVFFLKTVLPHILLPIALVCVFLLQG